MAGLGFAPSLSGSRGQTLRTPHVLGLGTTRTQGPAPMALDITELPGWMSSLIGLSRKTTPSPEGSLLVASGFFGQKNILEMPRPVLQYFCTKQLLCSAVG